MDAMERRRRRRVDLRIENGWKVGVGLVGFLMVGWDKF